MEKDPFIVLMLTDSATEAEINEAYTRLKKQYAEDRFLEGDEGYVAAKKLTELEQAYSDIQEILKTRQATQDFGSIYGEIESYIKNGNLELAQSKLDDIHERTAEWHYLQSILFYRKNWHSESKKQLEIAVSLDPNNAKYREALTKLNNVMNSTKGAVPPPNSYGAPNQNPNAGAGNNQYPPQQGPSPEQQMGTASNCCCSLLCADTCCECMGGDLISCC